jgi:hypothetical protein
VSVSQVAREAIEARLGWDGEEPREIAIAGIFSSSGEVALSEYIDSDEFKREYAEWLEADAFGRDP